MTNNKIKTIFIGTADFGLPALKALLKDDHFEILGVITQPDKPVGRKQLITPPPIKAEALKYNIPVHQPEKISNFKFQISNLDLIIVIAYAQIIPKNILEAPKYGVINVHGSLLPYCRGAACIQGPIIDGKKEAGVTIMLMDKGLDTGPIISQKTILIDKKDTAGSLTEKISDLGAELLIPTLKNYIFGKIKPQKQTEAQASYVKKLTKQDGHINWQKPAKEIERFIRAMTPWPGAFGELKIKNYELRIKILLAESKPVEINKYKPGTLFEYNNRLAIQCGKDALIINKIQLAGKKPIAGEEFIRGHNNHLGKQLN